MSFIVLRENKKKKNISREIEVGKKSQSISIIKYLSIFSNYFVRSSATLQKYSE